MLPEHELKLSPRADYAIGPKVSKIREILGYDIGRWQLCGKSRSLGS